jgi:hypothetical protein
MINLGDSLSNIVLNEQKYSQHYGVVTAITNSGGTYYLTVQLAGSTTAITNVRYLRSYVPRVNDTVLVNIYKKDAVVVDALAEANKSLNPVAYRTSTQVILVNTTTDISFQAVSNDDWGMWVVGSPTVLTCKVPGRYLAFGQILLEDASNIDLELRILKGTSTEIGRQDIRMTNADHDWHTQVNTAPFTMAINDTIKMTIRHNHNPDLDLLVISGGVDHTGFFPSLSVIYLGP